MEPVLTPEAMGRADRRTIDAGTPVSVLMARAGRAVAWEARRMTGGAYGRRTVVVCGKGNNGGDGLVTARALGRWGMRTHVVELAAGVDRRALERALERADVAIDAMYGTGFRGALEGDAAWFAELLAAWQGPVLSVDVPSGVDGLTGAVQGSAVRADRTVTFQARKTGIVFEPGRSHAGVVTVAPIGVDLGLDGLDPLPLGMLEADDIMRLVPPRAPTAHKWMAGVMVVGGSGGMTGAPMFVSHAAMRAGAGIVWCGLPGEAAARGAAGSEVITRALPSDGDGVLAPRAADAVLATISRFGALALGPGLGADPSIREPVRALVAEARVPLVLDADGLNALNGDFEALRARHTAGLATVLTPHDGEYSRLAGQPVGDDRVAAARRLADRAGAVVLLKGPATVVAEPAGARDPGGARVALNPTGTAALATAGSGDVLTGVIAAFLARGVPAFEAAAAAAWVHGRAGSVAAATVGENGVVASDLTGAIARTLRDPARGPEHEEP
jgi:ADP-dependent NAD(P)H-hydrate dehydratase / NAD(P)H-hydrate epimerase